MARMAQEGACQSVKEDEELDTSKIPAVIQCLECGTFNFTADERCGKCNQSLGRSKRAATAEAETGQTDKDDIHAWISEQKAWVAEQRGTELSPLPVVGDKAAHANGARRSSLLTNIVGPLMSIAFIGVVVSVIWRRSLDAPSAYNINDYENYAQDLESAADLFDVSLVAFCLLVVLSIYILATAKRGP